MEEVSVPMSVFVRNLLAWEMEQERQVNEMNSGRDEGLPSWLTER